MRRTRVALSALALAFAALPAIAAADPPPPAAAASASEDEVRDPTLLPRSSERRSGLVVGALGGPGLSYASGYPNNATKIGDPASYASSDVLAGGGFHAFLMGAVADTLNVGVFGGGGWYENADWKSRGAAGGLRLEAFPLFTLVPRLRDLGLSAQFGLGQATLDAKRGTYGGADGVQSFVGFAVFHEWRLLDALGGHMTFAPALEYAAVLSRSLDRHSVNLGLRVAFYGGP